MVGANYMELIGLTTAMADVRGTISATLREIQKQRGQFQGYYTDATDVQATVEATENSLAVVQTHLSYAMGYDGLLSVPGTNSDNYVTRASDYWDLGRTFELMKSEIESYPYQYDWASAPDTINDGLNDLTDAFASTLAAIGVEVWSWEVANIVLSDEQRSDLADEIKGDLEDAQTSTWALSQALDEAKEHILSRLEEIRED